ncbi:hypothetical protein CDAR_390361 [Caerostris darwini]|uniref:Uncharacterized protein n=1 Tax=Caerostris darwini TaxID=1538125 RepID=A0AAV4NXF2_9ARAC|nr:hypothetical protein CDAR_390361 [Caerostris darwini]
MEVIIKFPHPVHEMEQCFLPSMLTLTTKETSSLAVDPLLAKSVVACQRHLPFIILLVTTRLQTWCSGEHTLRQDDSGLSPHFKVRVCCLRTCTPLRNGGQRSSVPTSRRMPRPKFSKLD